MDGFGGGVGAGAGNDRNPLVGLFEYDPNNIQMLFVIQGGGFSGGAAGYNGIGSVLDLKIHQFTKFLLINHSVDEWGDYSYYTSFEHGLYLLLCKLRVSKLELIF
jgi:hypothetical protein